MNNIEFIWFDPASGTPKISIASYGFTLNETALKKLNNPKYIKVGFNETKNIMCIAISNENDRNSIEVRKTIRPSIYARFNYKGIILMLEKNKKNSFINTKRYTAKYTNETLIIDLNKKSERN